MGFAYERRGRAESLRDTDGTLIGYALSEKNIDFEKHDYQDVAQIVNRQLDRAAKQLRERFR